MSDSKKDSSGAIAPPPVIALVLIAIGVVLCVFWPVESVPAPWQYVVIAGAVLLVMSAFRLFQRAKTPVPTYRTPPALVTDGVFRISRNPIYLSLVLLMIGLAVTLDNIYLLALAVVC